MSDSGDGGGSSGGDGGSSVGDSGSTTTTTDTSTATVGSDVSPPAMPGETPPSIMEYPAPEAPDSGAPAIGWEGTQQSVTTTDNPMIGDGTVSLQDSVSTWDGSAFASLPDGESASLMPVADMQADAPEALAMEGSDTPSLSDAGKDTGEAADAPAMLEMWQREEPKIRPIVDYLREPQQAEKLDPATWRNMSNEERVRFLQGVHERVAQAYAIPHALVSSASNADLKDNAGDFTHTSSFYDRETRNHYIGRIRINQETSLTYPTTAVSTLLHESRHAYQWTQIQHPDKAPAELKGQLPTWEQEFADPVDAKVDGAGYYRQATEIDARAFQNVTTILFDDESRGELFPGGPRGQAAAKIWAKYQQGKQ